MAATGGQREKIELDPDRVILSWLLNQVAKQRGSQKAVIKGVGGAAWMIVKKNGGSVDEAAAAQKEVRALAQDLLNSDLEALAAEDY